MLTQTETARSEPGLPVARLDKRAKVVIVEDDDEMRALVEETLREEGYLAIGTHDTLSALILLFAEGADVLVTDWKMPAMDGIALLEAVRRSLPDVPVVFITAFAHPGLRARVLGSGAHSFIAKPFRRAELLASVREALAARGGAP